MREREQFLHRLFTAVEKRRQDGFSVRKALRRRWWGPRYHSDSRAKVRLSQERLVALYYYWVRCGKTMECLALHYVRKLPPVPLEVVRRFVGACAIPGVTSRSQALRLVDAGHLSGGRIWSALPEPARKEIGQAFRDRRAEEIAARAAVRRLQREFRGRLRRDVARSKRLQKLAGAVGA